MSLANKLSRTLLWPASDRVFSVAQYVYHQRRWPNLRHPKTLNEKIQWLKLNSRDPLLPNYVDKYLVRDYVLERTSEEYLVPAIGVYDDVDDIPWADLPDQFVLKATHGSGWNILCRDPAEFDRGLAIKLLRKWMKSNFYMVGREWAYKNVQPRILCEEFLSDENGHSPPDFKFFCFNGKPRFVQVDLDRFQSHRRNIYDTKWNLIPCELEYPSDPTGIPAPPTLAQMLDVAETLAEPFKFVRVDLYSMGQQIRFGELTLYPGKGVEHFRPDSYDLEFGSLLKLD